MESITCPNCQALVPAGAAFCGSCGRRMAARLDPTTRLTPPTSPPGPTLEANRPPVDPYASQYSPTPGSLYQPWPGQPGPLPRTEVLGGNVPPAMPPTPAPRRRRPGLIFVSILVLLALLSGGGYLLFNVLHHPAATTQSGGNGGTNGSGGGGPSLPSINRQAMYAGASFTILSADKAQSFPEFQKLNAGSDVVKVKAQLDNQTPHQLLLFNKIHLLSPDGSAPEPSVTNAASALQGGLDSGTSAVGYWYFEVNRVQSGVGVYKIVLGGADEVQETIPFTGSYDPSVWQWVTKPIGKSVTYRTQYGGPVIGTVVKVASGIWTPGYQSPKDMRFILTDMMVANQSAVPVYVSGDALKLQAPGGVPESPTTLYGYFINDSLSGGENKDEGYASFLVPPAQGDFILFFYNPDGSVAGQVDLGAL